MGFQQGVGWRFLPTEEELICVFLKNRAMGFSTPPNCGVVEKDLYGDSATPWMILTDDDPWQLGVESSSCRASANAAVIYVITELSKNSDGQKNKKRTAGCGTWHGTSKPRFVKNCEGEVIGTMRAFNFVSKSETRGNWIMHEYALAQILLSLGESSDYVICRITRRLDSRVSRLSISKGSRKRKAALDDKEKEPTVANYLENQESEFQENQELPSKKVKRRSATDQGGDDFGDWILDTFDFETSEGELTGLENSQNCEREIEVGGVAADQSHQNTDYYALGNCLPADWNGSNAMSGAYSSIVSHLFAEEDSNGFNNFPLQVLDGYLVPCMG